MKYSVRFHKDITADNIEKAIDKLKWYLRNDLCQFTFRDEKGEYKDVYLSPKVKNNKNSKVKIK